MTMLDGQTEDFHYLRLLLDIYGAARENGAIDVIGPDDNIDGYQLILPALMHVSDDLAERLEDHLRSFLQARAQGLNRRFPTA